MSKIFNYLTYLVYLMSFLFRNLIKYRLDFMHDNVVACPAGIILRMPEILLDAFSDKKAWIVLARRSRPPEG